MIKTDLIGLLFLVLALDKALHVKLIIRCNNMIKLTRGALTMLLAQYRGILKNAWIKNFAVAAALATTVTSAYAEDAKDFATWDEGVAASAKDATVKLNGQEKTIGEGDDAKKHHERDLVCSVHQGYMKA